MAQYVTITTCFLLVVENGQDLDKRHLTNGYFLPFLVRIDVIKVCKCMKMNTNLKHMFLFEFRVHLYCAEEFFYYS